MTISSAPAPSPSRSGAAGNATKDNEASPASPFESLLPGDASDPKLPPADTGGEPSETKPDDKTAPSPSEQTNLAALLYTAPALGPDSPVSSGPLMFTGATETKALSSAISSEAPAEVATDPTKPWRPGAADFAALQKVAAALPKTSPANSSAPPPISALVSSGLPVSLPLAKADVCLVPEPYVNELKSRGTSGAKPGVDMNQAPAINQISRSSAPTARSLAAGLIPPVAALNDELSKQTQDNGQNPLPTNGWDANSSNLDSFIAPFAPPASELGSSFTPTAAKPMSPATIVDLVGLNIDRMQNHGNSRVELRLSLEGGGSVSIELQFRDGAVHASFNTGSTELREALQQGWSQLANRSEALGMPLAAPVFKSPANAFANAGKQDFRDRHSESQSKQELSPESYGAPHQPKRVGPAITPARRANIGLNLWA